MVRKKSEARQIHEENQANAREFFSRQFSNLEDPRRSQGVRYPLPLVVISALLASVAGADDAQSMEYWSEVHKDWLAEFLEMPHGPPGQDVYLSVFGALCPENFEAVFRAWVSWLRVADDKQGVHVAIDGKASRGSAHGESPGLHTMNAWLVGTGLILAQEGGSKKRGEIKAIPELLKKLDIRGAVVSIDAIGCQRSIAKEIVTQGGDYFLQVKGNQPQLLDDCKRLYDAIDEEKSHHWQNATPVAQAHEESDKGHGRVETRQAQVSKNLEWVTSPENWCKLQNVVRIQRERYNVKTSQTSNTTAYYISSVEELSPSRALQLSRNHWAVESAHWILDVAFGEDAAQHRTHNTAENMSLLRKWSLNLVKNYKGRKCGVKNTRKIAGWDLNQLVKIITQPAGAG